MIPLLTAGPFLRSFGGPLLKAGLAIVLGLAIAFAVKYSIDSWREDIASLSRLEQNARRQAEILENIQRAQAGRDAVAQATQEAVARLSERRAKDSASFQNASEELKKMAEEAKANGKVYCPTPDPIVYAIGQLRNGVPRGATAGSQGGGASESGQPPAVLRSETIPAP